MKPHKPTKKTGTKQELKRRKDKKTKSKKGEKAIKTLSQKSEKGVGEKNLTKVNKRNEPKIKVLTHVLLASTLSYLMLAPW
jgi:hypothetical protein